MTLTFRPALWFTVILSAIIGMTENLAAADFITLKSMANGKYVCADNYGKNPLIANRTAASTWEKFEKINLGNGTFAFKSLANGKYVCADNYGNSSLIANRDAAKGWEAFWVVDMGAGRIALKAVANNKFVCAENSGNSPLIANRAAAQVWETFEMAIIPPDPIPPGSTFTIGVIPDSQFMVCWYHSGTPAMFERQIQWCINAVNDPNLNLVFVTHMGDVTDNGNVQSQWDNAKKAMFKLDNVVPYGIAPGNHDSMVMWNSDYSLLNKNFTVSKYSSKSWFGGTNKDNQYENNYELFSVAGMDFIIIHMAWNPSASVRAWASSILDYYPNRRAIISTHEYLYSNGGPTSVGWNIWNDVVKSHANVFMVLCGHNEGVSMVTTQNNAGKPVYQILTDYQGDNPQIGRLRYLTFKPSENKIIVSTYATETGKYHWDYDLPYQMTSGVQ